MQRPGSAASGLVLVLLAGACASSSLPTLPPSQPPAETGDIAGSRGAYEAAFITPGTPTGVYTLVARGALGCWFGAGGPLKATHVFQAEAEPPTKGGAAEIVLHERDVTLRDQRGVRAYRISFVSDATGVRVGTSALKIEPQLAQLMAKDVGAWARGGSSCELRSIMPPAPPAPVSGKSGSGPGSSKKR